MTQPLISVIIPVFNEEKRIGRAIQCMRDQTYRNLEIIVVDDNSTDGTRMIVETHTKEDPRVQYHRLEQTNKRVNWRGYDINAGYAARAYGFSLAQGEWLTTQDADDASLLNRVEVQHDLAKKYNATLVTIQWIQCNKKTFGKKLDIKRIFNEHSEEDIVIRPEIITERAQQNRGILMREPWHFYVPFPFKWFPCTRKLFYRRADIYPGADNAMFFHSSVIKFGFNFRHRNKRTWGTPAGRGSGRDFAYRIALHFKNSWSFRLPMYLWDVRIDNPEYCDYKKYLI